MTSIADIVADNIALLTNLSDDCHVSLSPVTGISIYINGGLDADDETRLDAFQNVCRRIGINAPVYALRHRTETSSSTGFLLRSQTIGETRVQVTASVHDRRVFDAVILQDGIEAL